MQHSSRGLLSLLTEYEDRIDQQRASGLTVIGFVLFILSLGWLTLVLLSVATAPEAQMAGFAHYAVTYAAPVISLAIWWLSRRGLLGSGAAMFVALLALFALTLMGGNLSFSSVALLTLPLAAAGGLMRRPGIPLTAALLV